MAKKDSSNERISEKYINALMSINDWTIVSDWAIKVGELFPDILFPLESLSGNSIHHSMANHIHKT